MEPIIKLEKINVYYHIGQVSKALEALKNITLEIYPGEYVIFFGPSGCGKSTLLNTIAGLQPINEGALLVCGKDLAKLNDDEIAEYHRHEVGFIFQAYNLIPTLSVLENIALPQMFDGASRVIWEKSAKELSQRFDILEQAAKLPQELSGGQQQRVGIARALINNPAIILADEPTGNLDSKNVRLVLDILQDLNLKDKKTILLVTHSMDYLTEADRIFYMKDGAIIKEEHNEQRQKKVITEKRGLGGETEKTELGGLKFGKLTEFILHVPNEQTVGRIKELAEKRLKREISAQELTELLDKPFAQGGAELNYRKAVGLSDLIECIVSHANVIKRTKELDFVQVGSTVHYLTEALIAAFGLHLLVQQKNRLYEVITDKLRGEIGLEEVIRRCDISLQKGGVGLRKDTARKVAYYLELVLLITNYYGSKKQSLVL